jgi:CBS domain containing-hemolysin-like protein
MSATDHGSAPPAVRPERAGLFERLRSMFGFEGASAREDVEEAIAEASKEGDFSQQELALLKNVLSLHELRVEDVMVPRADIIAVELTQTLEEILSLFRTANHSRLPVYSETLDDPRGMVHILDFVDFVARSAENHTARPRVATDETQSGIKKIAGSIGLDLSVPLSSANILRPVLFAPPSMPALDLLVKMQASRTHMALVIDEYGGTDGLVSIEDIMEMIVGDIEDEHDDEESPAVETAPDGSLILSARTHLDALDEDMGKEIATEADREEVDTIGGLVTAMAGRVPVRGEIVRISDTVEAEIIDADPRKLKRLKLRRIAVATSEE